jgi:hypothetical protein
MSFKNRPLIAVVSDHTDYFRNGILADLFNILCADNSKYRAILENYNFIFTGGTFERLFYGRHMKGGGPFLLDETKKFLRNRTIQLPTFERGGVIILTYLLLRNYCKIMWSFQTPDSPHHLISQNGTLRLISDLYRVRRLVNTASIIDWINFQAKRNLGESNCEYDILKLRSQNEIKLIDAIDSEKQIEIKRSKVENSLKILGIIVRKKHADRLVSFLKRNREKFSCFDKILITDIDISKNDRDALPSLYQLNSVDKGGLVEMAVEILFGFVSHLIIFDQPYDDDETNQNLNNSESDSPSNLDNVNNKTQVEFDDIISYKYQIILSACKINQDIHVKMNIHQANEWLQYIEEEFQSERNEETYKLEYKFTIFSDNIEEQNKTFGEFNQLIGTYSRDVNYTVSITSDPLEIFLTVVIPIIATPLITPAFEKFIHKISEFFIKYNTTTNLKSISRNISCEELVIKKHEKQALKFIRMKASQKIENKEVFVIFDGEKFHTYECDENGFIAMGPQIDAKYKKIFAEVNE